MSDTLTTLADELRDIAVRLEEAPAAPDTPYEFVDAIRNSLNETSIVEGIASDRPYTTSAALIQTSPSVLREELSNAGWVVFEDTDEAADYLAREHAETVRESLQRYDELTSGADPAEVEDISEALANLAADIEYLRHIDLDGVVDEVDELADRASRLAEQLRDLL